MTGTSSLLLFLLLTLIAVVVAITVGAYVADVLHALDGALDR